MGVERESVMVGPGTTGAPTLTATAPTRQAPTRLDTANVRSVHCQERTRAVVRLRQGAGRGWPAR